MNWPYFIIGLSAGVVLGVAILAVTLVITDIVSNNKEAHKRFLEFDKEELENYKKLTETYAKIIANDEKIIANYKRIIEIGNNEEFKLKETKNPLIEGGPYRCHQR